MIIMKSRSSEPNPTRKVPMTDQIRKKVERQRDAVAGALSIKGSADTGSRSYQRELADKNEARRRLKNFNGMLDKDDQARDYSDDQKRQMWQQADRLRREFRGEMVPKSDMHPAHINMKTGKPYIDEQTTNMAAQRHLRWEQKYGAKALEFKRLMRVLAPDKPELANLEYHRPVGQLTSKAVVLGGSDVK